MGTMMTGTNPEYIERLAEQAQVARDEMTKTAIYPQIVTKSSSKKLTIRTQNNENAQGISYIPEGARHPNLDFQPGFSTAITQHGYGGKFTISERMLSIYAQYDVIADCVRQLRLSDGAFPERVAADYLDYGDVTSGVPTIGRIPMAKTLGCDGVALFSSSHRWRQNAGYNFANKSDANYDLTRSAFQKNYTILRSIQDNAGRPLDIKFKSLIIPPSLRGQAYVVLNTDRQPETNNNALNEVKTMISSKEVVESQWLASSTRWYIQTDSQHGIKFFSSRMGLVRQAKLDNDTEAYMVKIDTELGHGVPTYLLNIFLVTN